MSKYEDGILSIALAKLASGELHEEIELERREQKFDDALLKHLIRNPTHCSADNTTEH